jgi:hypothetical protein
MAKKIIKEWATPLLTDLDSMIDQAVNSMDSKKLDELKIKRKAIMENLKQSTIHSVGPLEISEPEKPVLQA